MSKNERSALAQLRCGILPLRIETGRYINEPLHDRICRHCNSNEIENETHFLLFCTLYSELRNELFGNLFSDSCFLNKSSEEKLCFLLNDYIRKTAKFIVKAIHIRQNQIYS